MAKDVRFTHHAPDGAELCYNKNTKIFLLEVNEMKAYNNPDMEIIMINVEDILLSSFDEPVENTNDNTIDFGNFN